MTKLLNILKNVLFIFFISAFYGPVLAQEVSSLKNHDIDQSIEIEADSFEIHQKNDLVIYKGNVVIVQGDLKMVSNEVTAHYDPATGSLNPTIARIDAMGEVKITSPSESAEGNWGVYDVKGRMITMGGNILLKRGENIIIGERLELDLDSGIIKIDGETRNATPGRVKGTFKIPKKNEN